MEPEAELLCFPQLHNASCRTPAARTEVLLLHVLFSIVSVITTALNLLVIIAVSHFRQLHTPSNLLLLSLAVADFLLGLLVMPLEILRSSSCWFLGDVVCSFYNSLSYTITSASVGDMVLVCVDRYVAVCDPLRYTSRVTEGRVKVCVCLCWLCSGLYGTLIMMEDFRMPGRLSSCVGQCTIIMDQLVGTVDLLVSFVLPVLLIVGLYLRVFVVAVSQAKAVRSQTKHQTQAKNSELKAARTLGVLVLVFLVCFVPYYCISLAGEDLLSDAHAAFVLFLFYFNSTLNPLIYTLFYPWFRKAIQLIVTLQILEPGSAEANVMT